MSVSDVRQRDGRSRSAGGPAFDLLASKLRRPVIRPGTVCRPALVERLARDGPGPVVSVVAPAGYGKTTLLSQWAEGNGQAFAWVSVDEGDNDAKVLLSYVAAALDAVEPTRQVPGRSCVRSMTCSGAGPASVLSSGRPGHSRHSCLGNADQASPGRRR